MLPLVCFLSFVPNPNPTYILHHTLTITPTLTLILTLYITIYCHFWSCLNPPFSSFILLCCVELLCASTGTGVTFLRLGLGLRVRVRLCECVRLYAVSFHPFSKRLYSLQKTVSHPLLYPLIPFSAPAPGSVFSDVSPPLSASSASVTACFGASIASAPGIFLDYGLFLGYGIFGLGSIRARVFLSKGHFGLARVILG